MVRGVLRHSLLLLAASYAAYAEWIPVGSGTTERTAPQITLLNDDANNSTIRVDLSGFEVKDIAGGRQRYQSIGLLTDIVTMEPGSPEVPHVAAILAIPGQGGASVEVIEMGEVHTFTGYVLPPARPSWKEGDPEPAYVENDAAYRSTSSLPGTYARVEEPGVFRDLRIARVVVYPVQYVPSRKELQVLSSITIRVRYGSGEARNPKTSPKRPIAPSFGTLYRSSVLNYENMLQREFDGLETGRDVLLCIAPDTFYNTFRSYAEWKHKTGTYTVVKKFSEIGANATNPDLIKNYIAQAYTTWTYPPTHILLVGDYGKVPRKTVSYDYTFANEDFFVELEGNDFFPEMMIGRFTHDTDYRLQVMISKFLKYEQTPYRANQTWFKKATVCSNNAYISQVQTKRFTAQEMLTYGGFLSVDTMMSSTPCIYDLTDILSAINNGRSYLNYRGEGWTTGWWADCYPFQTSDVSSVNNGQMLTFVTSIGCGVAMFDASGGNAFGEEWLELGTPTAPRGACAFVGPTSNTHTAYNNKIDKGIYIGMFEQGMETPGQALLRGKLYMYEIHGNDPWVEYHYRIYCVLGDPSIHVWRNVPRSITVTYPPQISIGYNQIEVAVVDSANGSPVTGVQVCMAADTVYAVGTTNESGRAYLTVAPTSLDTFSLVVRGNTVVPAEGRIPVVNAPQHVTPFGNPVIVDLDGNLDGRVNPNEHCQVTFTLKNWGTQTAPNVMASLSAEDTTYAQVIGPGSVSFGDIPSSGTASGAPFQFFVKPVTNVGQTVVLRLHVTSGAQSWDYAVLVEVTGCKLSFVSYVVNDQGSATANGRMDPGETVVLYTTIANTGEDVAPEVSGVLSSTDPYITIQDHDGTYGTLFIDDSASNATDFFVVSVADSCPAGYQPQYSLLLSTHNGRYPYAKMCTLFVPVGVPVPGDPTGPDPYGYYGYSSDDTLYEQAPHYNWFEILGLGTEVPRNPSGDFTVTVTLPFTFKYYGINYTQLRVSSDGWIAFGSGTQVAYQNYGLPYDDNVNCMVAPFWDDLFASGSGETGKLLYYSDVSNHRFIVEWHAVGHWIDSTDRETFQAIVLDPAFYPTASGNGEIIFQYHTIVEDGSCTIGTENNTENIGLQYAYNAAYHLTASEIRNQFAIRFTTELPVLKSRAVNISVMVRPGWNLIANPVQRPDSLNGVQQLFPSSVYNYAFEFHPATGYTQATNLPNGPGYWGKFPATETIVIYGDEILEDSVAIETGWNIIGSISSFVDTATVLSVPPGIRGSVFFGYASGYSAVRYLVPGQAYWVKGVGPGILILGSSSSLAPEKPGTASDFLANLNLITLTDSKGSRQTLFFGPDDRQAIPLSMFAMPPLPPADAFDARFETEQGGSLVCTHSVEDTAVQEFPIVLQTASYPVSVSWNVRTGHPYTMVYVDGEERPVQEQMAGTGEVLISNTSLRRVVVRLGGAGEVPKEFALFQNYPNPFNPSTSVRYGLPVQSAVTLEVFNMLGQRVRTLLNTVQSAGYHVAAWDGRGDQGRQAGSGVYFIRMNAKGPDSRVFSDVRKMLLLK
jgi:hypothetical protein